MTAPPRMALFEGGGLVVRNLEVDYVTRGTRRRVLNGIDLQVAPGEIVGLVGESGSGKSTLAYAIVRYLGANARVRADELSFAGQNLLALGQRALRRLRGTAIGMVYQDPATALNPTLRLGEQLAEAVRRGGTTGRALEQDEMLRLLDMVRLPNPDAILRRFPHEASGGERQRLLIAMAYAMRPALMIFDEATTALDATTASGIIDLVQRLQGETGVATLFISHDLGTVARLTQRVVVLYKGDIVEAGPTAAVLGNPREDYTKKLTGSRPDPFAAAPRARPATPPPVLLSAEGLVVRYGRRTAADRLFGRPGNRVQAVRGVDLAVRRGTTVGLVGESGCGKSTLARALVGLAPFEGTVRFGERTLAPADIDRAYRRAAQIIFQNPDLSRNPRLPVRELVGRPLKLYGLVPAAGIEAAVAELLDSVRLPGSYAGRYTSELSGGEKQRVAIARAFAARPELVICDEITSSLDVSVQASILALLADLQREHGTAYLFISHDLQVVQMIADEIAVMYFGGLVERRHSGGQVLAPPMHPYSEALLSSAPVTAPGVRTRRVSAVGPLPSAKAPPRGCAFASRCARRLGPVCETEPPPRRTGPDGHEIACHIPWNDLAAVPPIWTRVTS